MRKIAEFAINRPASIIVLMTTIIIMGLMNLSQLPVALMPDMTLPYAAVFTNYPGAGPEEVEEKVTKPVESALATINNIDKITSTSNSGSSMIMIQFKFGTNIDTSMTDIRDKVSEVESELPKGIRKPQAMKFNFAGMPIITYTITAKNLSLAQLQTIADNKIKSRLARIPEIASVSIAGGHKRQVQVSVDPVKAENYGLSLGQVSSFLSSENYNMSGGKIIYGDRKYFVRNMQQFESIEDIGNVALTTANGNKILLKDIAKIGENYQETEQISRTNGRAAVSIICQKGTGANTVSGCKAVKEEMEKIKQEMKGQIDAQIVDDQSDYINKSIQSTARTMAEGAVLAVLIILLFLRNLRSTSIVAIAIPLSIVATFVLMYYNGSTLNIITLGGLSLGVGRMVDDSIVVFENIYRHRSLGLSPKEAALKGTSEVGGAVLAGTLTLLAVFLPIGMAKGMAGVIFKPLAFTICVAILASLVVSLTIVPFMSSRMLTDKAMEKGDGQGSIGKIMNRLGDWLDNLGEKYKIILQWALSNRKTVILSVTGLIVVSLMAIPFVGAEFMPTSDQGMISIALEADKGSKLSETEKITAAAEKIIKQNSAVDSIFTSIGNTDEWSASGTNKSKITVKLIPKNNRKGVVLVTEEIRQSLAGIPNVKKTVKVQTDDGGESSSAISIAIQGDDLNVLRGLSKDVKEIVKQVPGTREVRSSLADGDPEVQVRVNRQKALYYGLTPQYISSEVTTAIDGMVAGKYRAISGKEIDIRVTSSGSHAKDLETLTGLNIITPSGDKVKLSDLAAFKLTRGPVQIDRLNQMRRATVSCDLLNRDLNSVTKDIESKVDKIKLPAGYTVSYGGADEEMQKAFSSLLLSLLLALMLVYVVMVIQYESFMNPFVIMFSLPSAIIGIILALLITGRHFSVNAFIGVIMLAGIAVSNAIVLVDYLNKLRESGMERDEAIAEAGKVRLRPILMTALATILAMLPMALALGDGAETNAPLATVVIGGLLVSTFVTLLLVPVVYSLFDDWVQKIGEKRNLKQIDEIVVN